VLANLVARVHTIEIVRPLGEAAAELPPRAGPWQRRGAHRRWLPGWPEAAPFDAIMVTAAPEKMPQPLVDQLAPGGG
jgi:protein-L-isoaspartate(D-aspartate) O-methyltransferase